MLLFDTGGNMEKQAWIIFFYLLLKDFQKILWKPIPDWSEVKVMWRSSPIDTGQILTIEEGDVFIRQLQNHKMYIVASFLISP